MVYALYLALMILPAIVIIALFFVFWIIMLVDCITRKFKNDTEKVLWILVLVLTGLVGALIYYFVVHINDKKKSMKWFWITLLILVVLVIFLAVLYFISLNPNI